ncbi:hypothetical protein HAX54_018558 [Datura stramonium]|uniref:Uncharacterized protein n=1 Tax=Datura stramonium TaxID=4076 RepID=A0ABS8UNT2_DATST|nr:hypothetical protein [Datura stramonium]
MLNWWSRSVNFPVSEIMLDVQKVGVNGVYKLGPHPHNLQVHVTSAKVLLALDLHLDWLIAQLYLSCSIT